MMRWRSNAVSPSASTERNTIRNTHIHKSKKQVPNANWVHDALEAQKKAKHNKTLSHNTKNKYGVRVGFIVRWWSNAVSPSPNNEKNTVNTHPITAPKNRYAARIGFMMRWWSNAAPVARWFRK